VIFLEEEDRRGGISGRGIQRLKEEKKRITTELYFVP